MSQSYKIMGVINVTPDSFSDGGKFYSLQNAINQAIKLIDQGADIIDIGGESTRPGALPVSTQEQLDRVIPVITQIRKHNKTISISIDTTNAKVMQESIKAGADFINDVNALQEEGCIEVVAQSNLPVCLMHKKGQPKTMQNLPQYEDVVEEVMSFFKERIQVCLHGGIQSNKIILDPGIGFGKSLSHNLTLLKNIKTLKSLGYPVLIGVSRKAMIGQLLDETVDNRLFGSLAVAQYAFMNGASIFRVHDVKETSDVLKITQKLMR